MQLRQKPLFILSCIVLVAALLRFVQLGSNPPSLYWDEVSQGNNAYLIAKTGRDEHREFLPLARFVAYGDYKAPIYIYIDVPFVALLGKTALAVRFPSALFGTLTVLLCYFLTIELFFEHKRKHLYGLFSAFFLAISPWHIQLSRAAYEANIATFFTVLGVWMFFYAMRKNAWMLIGSSVSFVIAMYAFNAHRVFVPLLSILLALLYWRKLIAIKKEVIIALLVGFILFLPLIQFLRTPEGKLRYNEVNIFSDTTILQQQNKDIQDEGNTLFAKTIHNRRIAYGLLYLKHYFDFFSPDFLFIHGDVNPRFSLQDNGELYLWELPLLLSGIYFLVSQKNKKTALFLFGWFLLAPIAGATARETPHALRAETFIPLYDIFAGLGAVSILFLLQKLPTVLQKTIAVACTLVIVLSIFLFQYNYYVDYPYLYSEVWQDGYKATIQKTEQLKNNFDRIIFTEHYGRAYAYVLFYSRMTPQEFWQRSDFTRDQFGLYNVSQEGKYTFARSVKDVQVKNNERVLFVAAPDDLPANAHVLDTVYLLNGHPGFILATNQ